VCPENAKSPAITRAPATYTDHTPTVGSKDKRDRRISDGYDVDYLSAGEELHARRAYGGFADEVDDLRLARAVGSVDRGGRDPRAGTKDAHGAMRVWGEAS
jgi:hypothetical protein